MKKERPSLEELKQRCFKQNVDPRLQERYKKSYAIYYAFYVTHFFSIRIVRFLYPYSVTPNQVTIVSILAGFLSAVCFSVGSNLSCLLGAFLFELCYLLDSVDGQLARAKGNTSLGGKYLDIFSNFIGAPVVVFGMGIGVMRGTSSLLLLSITALSAYSLVLITVMEMVRSHLLLSTVTKGRRTEEGRVINQPLSEKAAGMRLGYSLLYRSCTMPVVMNIVTVMAIVNLFSAQNMLSVLVWYWAFAGTLVWVLKVIHMVGHNLVSRSESISIS